MFIRQDIRVGNLLLDVGNYRIVKQSSQPAARAAIIAEQGKKLVTLATDIAENGPNPFDLPLVIDAEDGLQNYIVIEGNRRVTAIHLMLSPELAEGTPFHAAFKRLYKNYSDRIPKVLDCVIAQSRAAGRIWINRKHQSGLSGAGTEPWSSISKARADAESGENRPDLDVVNFVLTNPALSHDVRNSLEGSTFSITTLERLLKSKKVQSTVGFEYQDGKLVSEQGKERIQSIMSEIVTVIVTGKHDGEKFTERDIDTEDRQIAFISKIVEDKPKRQSSGQRWEISGKPVQVKKPTKSKKPKGTQSTAEQTNLIPKSFKLDLPSGKINDIFVELKQLYIIPYRHAISVLFRVFLELTLDEYIKKHSIQIPKDGSGRKTEKMSARLQYVTNHVKETKLLTDDELKPVFVAIADKDSLLAPDTLNAYVHSKWMNPDPQGLKTMWLHVHIFVERLWESKPQA